MKNSFEKTSRRKFLKYITGSVAATTIGITGCSDIKSTSRDYQSDLKVFSVGYIGSLRLKNRLIRASTLERAGLEGYPTDTYLKMFESQSAGGVGLIITGCIDVATPTSETLIRIYDDQYITGLNKIVRIVHSTDNECKIMAQLWHKDDKLSPSGISWTGNELLKIMSVEQIKNLIDSFSEAIRRAKDAGFDGVELNAHRVYALSSFLSPLTNKRTDDYGGSVGNRVRLVREIVEQAKTKVGKDFPIIIKLNCDDSFSPTITSEDGINIDNFHLLASEIEKAGFDAIELSSNSNIRKNIVTLDKESYFCKYAENLNLNIPIILTGGNRSLNNIEEILKNSEIDFFGFARPFIREPDLAKQWLEQGNTVKSKCISCNLCLDDSTPLHCMQENE